MTTTATIHARGMSAQLDRVNRSPGHLLERITDLERQIACRDQIIADLRAELAALNPPRHEGEGAGGEGFKSLMHNNRPAASAAQIAAQHHVNISNVYRQLQKNKLAGTRVDGHWIVYLDQPISFKSYHRRV